MYYFVDLSIPAGTQEYAPYQVFIKPLERTVSAIQIDMLTDPANSVGIRIADRREKRFVPWYLCPVKWLRPGAVGVIDLPSDEYSLFGSPYEITIEAYNTGGSTAEAQIRLVVTNMTLYQATQGLLGYIRDQLVSKHAPAPMPYNKPDQEEIKK